MNNIDSSNEYSHNSYNMLFYELRDSGLSRIVSRQPFGSDTTRFGHEWIIFREGA